MSLGRATPVAGRRSRIDHDEVVPENVGEITIRSIPKCYSPESQNLLDSSQGIQASPVSRRDIARH